MLAVEILTAARGIELRAPLTSSAPIAAAIVELRRHIAGPGPDRYLAPDLAVATDLVRAGSLLRAAQPPDLSDSQRALARRESDNSEGET